MKIPKETVLLKGNLLHGLVISGLTATLKGEAFREFIDINWSGKDEVDIQFLIEGVELNIEDVLERWEEDMDRQIALKAEELVAEKFTKVSDFLYNLEQGMKSKVRSDLGLDPDEYDY